MITFIWGTQWSKRTKVAASAAFILVVAGVAMFYGYPLVHEYLRNGSGATIPQ